MTKELAISKCTLDLECVPQRVALDALYEEAYCQGRMDAATRIHELSQRVTTALDDLEEK